MPRAVTLPNDIETLKRLVLEAARPRRPSAASLAQLEIEQLKLQIARLRRMQFGRSSEALDEQIAQLEFKLEELESEEASLPVPAPPAAQRRKSVRRPLPERSAARAHRARALGHLYVPGVRRGAARAR